MCGEAYTDLNDKTLEALESICFYMLFFGMLLFGTTILGFKSKT
jgi:hypothetical protein